MRGGGRGELGYEGVEGGSGGGGDEDADVRGGRKGGEGVVETSDSLMLIDSSAMQFTLKDSYAYYITSGLWVSLPLSN